MNVHVEILGSASHNQLHKGHKVAVHHVLYEREKGR
jgi:hypothetical protein